VAFGAPQGQRVGDAAKAMAFYRLGAATPPMVLRRPNPKGIFRLRTSFCAPGPMHNGIESRRATLTSSASRRRATTVIPVAGHSQPGRETWSLFCIEIRDAEAPLPAPLL
jgi:hypothetical protein